MDKVERKVPECRNRLLSISDADTIKEMHRNGFSMAELARKYGVSFSVVKNIIYDYSPSYRTKKVKKKNITDKDIEHFIALHNGGMSWQEVAKDTGWSFASIIKKVDDYNKRITEQKTKTIIESLNKKIDDMQKQIDTYEKVRMIPKRTSLTLTEKHIEMLEKYNPEQIGYIVLGCLVSGFYNDNSFFDAAKSDIQGIMYNILQCS